MPVRNQLLVVEGMAKVASDLPFPMLGVDTDNDSAFMNDVVVPWCREQGLEVTRSRAYRKNDQAWVEQKNGAVVRRLVGYARFEGLASGSRARVRVDVHGRMYAASVTADDHVVVGTHRGLTIEARTVLVTGGTGITARDQTFETVSGLLTKTMPGYGELFRMLSYEEIGTSTVQSRAEAALCDKTFVFVLPGSTGAVRTAMTRILLQQLDYRHRPCNFVELLPRIQNERED